MRSTITRNVTGPQIRRYRVEQSLTQEAFTARCGVAGWRLSRGTLAKIEAQVRGVSDAELFILAKALKKPVEALYPNDKSTLARLLKQSD